MLKLARIVNLPQPLLYLLHQSRWLNAIVPSRSHGLASHWNWLKAADTRCPFTLKMFFFITRRDCKIICLNKNGFVVQNCMIFLWKYHWKWSGNQSILMSGVKCLGVAKPSFARVETRHPINWKKMCLVEWNRYLVPPTELKIVGVDSSSMRWFNWKYMYICKCY